MGIIAIVIATVSILLSGWSIVSANYERDLTTNSANSQLNKYLERTHSYER